MNRRTVVAPSIIVAVLLLVAVLSLPYWYYQFLRWMVCGISLFVAYQVYQQNKSWSTWLFVAIAILFNPFTPITFEKYIWQNIDIVSAIIFLAIPVFSVDNKLIRFLRRLSIHHSVVTGMTTKPNRIDQLLLIVVVLYIFAVVALLSFNLIAPTTSASIPTNTLPETETTSQPAKKKAPPYNPEWKLKVPAGVK